MSYILDLSQRAPQRLAKLKATGSHWREAHNRQYVTGKAPAYNPPGSFYGETHCRWVENVHTAGLRVVGTANDINARLPAGWYSDSFQDETLVPVVYQLPTRKGVQRFVYGYADPCNEGAAFLSFDPCDNKDDAARWADSFTERAADDQREEDAKNQSVSQCEDIDAELVDIRKATLQLIRETRASCPAFKDAPGIRATIERAIRAALDLRGKLRARRDALASNYWLAVEN